MKRNKLLTRLAAALVLFATPVAHAAEGAGSIEGRIQDVGTGDYLNNARVTIDGTNLTTLTNQFGEYRFTNVPGGEVQVKVFYSGLPSQTATLVVTPGQRVVRDFELKSGAPGTQTIQLEAFVVRAEQLTDAAIAVNEQRFAPNMKTVLSAANFGDQSEGNVGEFLKYMPGMQVSYVEQDVRDVSLRGMPSHATIVMANGNQLASASSSSANRVFEFEQLSINDLAQIEFNKTLVPDMPAEGIGGTINLVTKSAFQRSRPQFNYRTSINFNTTRLELRKMPGPSDRKTFLIRPGFDFTYIKPLSRNLGFTVSGALSSKYNPQYIADWNNNLNRNVATGVENPFIDNFFFRDSPKMTNRYSGRVGVDWRFAPHDVLSVGFSEQYYEAYWTGRTWNPRVGTNPATIESDFVQGRSNAGRVNMSFLNSYKAGTTWTPDFKYTHNGPVWRFEARGAYSHASNRYRGTDRGHFNSMSLSLGSLNAAGAFVEPTVRMDYVGNYAPHVTVQTASGVTVDSQDANNYFVNSAGAIVFDSTDVKKTAAFYGQRIVNLGVPIKVKAGGDIRQSIRDMRRFSQTYTFVGADGRALSSDDRVAALGINEVNYPHVTPPYGLAKFKWVDLSKAWELYKSHPDWWTRNLAAEHTGLVSNSKFIDETITSGFVRLDASFFRNRLTTVTGVRMQDYRVHSESGVVNNLGKYLEDEEGNLIINPETGRPLLGTGNALEVAEKTNIERGVVSRGTTKGYYPSFNATYRVSESVQLRAGYANSVNYPNLNQVAAGSSVSDVSASTRRVVANSPLKPWFGRNYDFDIGYYTRTGGSYTLSFFRKEISDFVANARYFAGTPEAAAALERWGYGQLVALGYEIVERANGGRVEFDGWEFDFQQNLDAYTPGWARGLTVFFNTSYSSAPKGVGTSNIATSAASQRLFNWGATYRRGRLGGKLKWNHVPEPKYVVPLSATGVHRSSRTLLDVDVSYQIRPRMALFISGANVTSVATETYVYTSDTPEWARRRQFRYFGVQYTAGIKGQF